MNSLYLFLKTYYFHLYSLRAQNYSMRDDIILWDKCSEDNIAVLCLRPLNGSFEYSLFFDVIA